MATVSWAAPESIATALDTGLNSLASNDSQISAAIDNETDKYLYLNLELVLASLTPATVPYVALYALYSLDGTNYQDGSDTVIPQPNALLCVLALSTSTGAKRLVAANLPIAPLKFKLVLENQANVALAASGNTLKYRRHNGTVA